MINWSKAEKVAHYCSVTAEQWVPLVEVPEVGVMDFLLQKKKQGFSLLGLEQTANSVSIDSYSFPRKSVSEIVMWFRVALLLVLREPLLDHVTCRGYAGAGAG